MLVVIFPAASDLRSRKCLAMNTFLSVLLPPTLISLLCMANGNLLFHSNEANCGLHKPQFAHKALPETRV